MIESIISTAFFVLAALFFNESRRADRHLRGLRGGYGRGVWARSWTEPVVRYKNGNLLWGVAAMLIGSLAVWSTV